MGPDGKYHSVFTSYQVTRCEAHGYATHDRAHSCPEWERDQEQRRFFLAELADLADPSVLRSALESRLRGQVLGAVGAVAEVQPQRLRGEVPAWVTVPALRVRFRKGSQEEAEERLLPLGALVSRAALRRKLLDWGLEWNPAAHPGWMGARFV